MFLEGYLTNGWRSERLCIAREGLAFHVSASIARETSSPTKG